MKIFRSEQIREIDEYTIKNEPVASIDLMERAAGQLYKWITERYGRSVHFMIFAGPGNNGGDGLALARMLGENGYHVDVIYIKFTEKTTPDWETNMGRLKNVQNVTFNSTSSTDQLPLISTGDIIIDAIFGSGLTRPVGGFAAEVIKHLNHSDAIRISIDIPSGLFGENNSQNSYDSVVKADFTLSFQFPKLSFMFAENAPYSGDWSVLPIGLDNNVIRSTPTPYTFLGNDDIRPLIHKRNKFDHKGIFGHGLLVSGSLGKMGAAVMGAYAALKTGIGLVTCHVPGCGISVIQSALPEAMVKTDKSETSVSEIGETDNYTAIGIGPGLGTEKKTQAALLELLKVCKKPLVIDADALNILSLNKGWLSLLPSDTILTPHPKEFERLAGKSSDGYARLEKQIKFSHDHRCVVVLKGAHTSISLEDGSVFFNSTGNPGMAKGGSGDVLTGIILSLLAQGYSSRDSAVLGVYLHGLAGDIAASQQSTESIIASDIINSIGKAFNKIKGQ